MRAAPARILTQLLLAGCAAAVLMPAAHAQSKSGFTYNGIDLVSYEASEYESSTSAAQTIKATGANYAAVVVTQYQQTGTATSIAPETTSSSGYNGNDPITPTDDAVVAAIQNLQAQGITVMMKPLVNSIDGTWSGDFTYPGSDTTDAEQQAWLTAWFTSYQTFILHYAQIASQNNVSLLLIGSELVELSGSNCGGVSCRSYWDTYIINPLRAAYPNMTLVYAANATTPGDEFTTVTFWDQVDVIGVDGYFDLTDQQDPTVSQLVSAWTDSPAQSGFNPEGALYNLASQYTKPLIFTEIGYKSTAGANEEPWNYALSNGYDPTEQEDCYEAFFEVFSAQAAWMKGVFWWEWTVSPPGSDDTNYTPQNKPAGDTVLPEWYGAAAPGFTLAAFDTTLTLGRGLATTDTIAVTTQGGFGGTVTLSAGTLPSGVSASFSAGSGAGTQILTLTATSGATLQGPIAVSIIGTSGALTSYATLFITVQAATAQTISFTNPGSQQIGTRLVLGASASSGLAVSYSTTTSGICSVNSAEATASILATGTCSITASQAGNGIYSAATSVTESFLVTSLATVTVPAADEAIVYQLNWLAALGGEALVSESPAGSSFGVTTTGELVVADTANLVLYNTQTGAATTLGAWLNAQAVAIDPSNNIYVADLYGTVNGIVKVPYVGGATNGGYAAFTTPAPGLATCTTGGATECQLPSNVGSVAPGAMVFDKNGNLFWETASAGASGGNGIWKCTAACIAGTGSPVEIYQEPTASPAPSTSSGQLLVGALAIDSAGNLFFTDSSIYIDPTSSDVTSFYSDVNELPVSGGTGYGGNATGYAASPVVLYTMTPSTPGPYDDEIDGVAVLRNSTRGDTVYFADQANGIFAFPDSASGIPLSSGKPSALYMVSAQGGKSLNVDSQGNLYIGAYSKTINASGADTMAQITLDSVTTPASPIGTASTPSATLNQVAAIVNDASCTSTTAPAITFVASASPTGTATLTAGGNCYTLLTGASSIDAAASYTPSVSGPGSVTFAGTDQASDGSTVIVKGAGTGFTLAPTTPSLTVNQGGSGTDTINITDVGGFAGAVTLSATGLPTGVTAVFATNPTTSSSLLTLTASAIAPAAGPVTVTITGVSGAITQTTTIAVTVVVVPIFTLAPTTASLTVIQGANNTDALTLTALNGFSGDVTLSASGLPTGVSASFTPNPASTTSTLTLTATSTATTGGPVTVTITGVSGALTETTTVSLTVTAAPSFALAPTAGTLTVGQGGSNTDSISITPANGFTGSVTFTASNLPTGVTASFSPNPTSSAATVLMLTASSSAVVGGPVTVTITGTSGTLTETTTVALTVNAAPSFSLYPWPTGIAIAQGASGTNTITVLGANGFTNSVTFSASGLPTGVTAGFSPNPSTSSTTMTLTASSTATLGGPVLVTITGVSGTLTETTTIALTVLAPPSFTLASSPGSVVIGQGGSATSAITVTPANNFAAPVTLSASGLPSGVTASFNPNPAATYSVLTLTASSTAAPVGPVTVSVNGTSGALNTSTSVALTVTPPAGFALSALPTAVTVTQGSTATSTVFVIDVGGFAGAVALSASGLPTGVTASFTTGTLPGTQVLTLTASSTATPVGPVLVTISGVSGLYSGITTLAVTVTAPPTFTFSGSALTVTRGSATGNTITVTVTPQNGFTGTISLGCAVEPQVVSDSATCSLSPTSLIFAGNTPQTATLTIYTVAPVTALNRGNRIFWPSAGGTVLAALFFFWVPRRRRAWLAMFGLLTLFIAAGSTGCISGNAVSTSNPGTPTGTYYVTLTGTSGNVTATSQIEITIQ